MTLESLADWVFVIYLIGFAVTTLSLGGVLWFDAVVRNKTYETHDLLETMLLALRWPALVVALLFSWTSAFLQGLLHGKQPPR